MERFVPENILETGRQLLKTLRTIKYSHPLQYPFFLLLCTVTQLHICRQSQHANLIECIAISPEEL